MPSDAVALIGTGCLNQHFSDFLVQVNPLGILLKCRIWFSEFVWHSSQTCTAGKQDLDGTSSIHYLFMYALFPNHLFHSPPPAPNSSFKFVFPLFLRNNIINYKSQLISWMEFQLPAPNRTSHLSQLSFSGFDLSVETGQRGQTYMVLRLKCSVKLLYNCIYCYFQLLTIKTQFLWVRGTCVVLPSLQRTKELFPISPWKSRSDMLGGRVG